MWTLAMLALVAALTLAPEPTFAQCRMCRTALESPEAAGLASALRRGVLFLLATPFLTVGVIAVLIARARRKPAISRSAGAITRDLG